MTYREILRLTGKTERRGGYPRSWRGVAQVWGDMIAATPMLDVALGRGDFSPRRPARWCPLSEGGH